MPSQHCRLSLLLLGLLLVAALSGCTLPAQPPEPELPTPAAAPVDLAELAPPEEVARSFYTWYVATVEEGAQPLQSGAYRERPELMPAFVQHIDALLVQAEPLVADPLLCAPGCAADHALRDQ